MVYQRETPRVHIHHLLYSSTLFHLISSYNFHIYLLDFFMKRCYGGFFPLTYPYDQFFRIVFTSLFVGIFESFIPKIQFVQLRMKRKCSLITKNNFIQKMCFLMNLLKFLAFEFYTKSFNT